MKILTGLLVLFCINLSAQAPTWQWSQSAGTGRDDLAFAITNSINGSVVATGTFKDDSIVFGTISLYGTSLVVEHMYVVKYDVSGNVLWARSAFAPNGVAPSAICSDPAGNIYITGKVMGDSLRFNSSGNSFLTLFYADMFIVKYDAAGNVVWARQGSGPTSGGGEGYPNAISADAAGNVYVAGSFTGTSITFSFYSVNNSSTNPSVAGDIFMVKYSASGVFQWLIQGGGYTYDNCYGVSVDSAGYAYIAGYFSGSSANFGSIVLTNVSFDNEGFVIKVSPVGGYIWARIISGANDDDARAVDCDNNRVVVGGVFLSDSIHAGSSSVANSDNSGMSRDYFIASYDTAGNLQWVTGDGSVGAEILVGVAIGGGSAIYVAGNFYTTFTVGSSTVTAGSGTLSDVFVAGYTSGGVGAWAKAAGGTNNDYCEGIAADSAGNICITGYYKSSMITFNQTWTCTNANYDVFVAAVHSTTDVHDAENPSTFVLFPNPAGETTTIQPGVALHDVSVKVFSATGQMVYEKNYLSNDTAEIDCRNFESGIYFVQLSSGTEVSVQKLLVE